MKADEFRQTHGLFYAPVLGVEFVVMEISKELADAILTLKDRIFTNFTEGDWQEVALLTGLGDTITGYHRLLRSLNWHDEDYPGNILGVLQQAVAIKPEALKVIEVYVDKKYPDESGEYISITPAPPRKIAFAPNVFAIPTVEIERDLVSVMMPFGAQFNDVYKAIQTACTGANLRCDRADNVWEDYAIINDIFSLIFRSRIVVCDFSGKNPNVMYETGIAHTLGKHVVPITQSMDDVPFDIRHHRVLVYLNNGEGLATMTATLQKKLASMLA